MRDMTELYTWPGKVRLVAYDLTGKLQIDQTFDSVTAAVDEVRNFIGGTVCFLAPDGTKLWEEMRA